MEEEKKVSGFKVLKRIIKIISAVVSLLSTAVFVFALLLFDPFVYAQEYTEYTIEELSDLKATNSFLSVNTDGEFEYELNAAFLNEFLHKSFEKNKDLFINPTQNVYVMENDDGYDFVFDVIALNNSAFHSRLKVHTVLEESDTEFIFNVKDMFVGKLNAINFVKGRKLLTDETINKLFGDCYLSIESHLDENKFVYTKENVIKDFNSHIHIDDELFSCIYDEFGFNLTSTPFKLTINPLPKDKTYTYDPIPQNDRLNIKIGDYRYAPAIIIKDHPEYTSFAEPIYRYLLKGYDSLSIEEKATIEGIDFKQFGISETKEYKGYPISFRNEDKVEYNVKKDLNALDTSSFASGTKYQISSITGNELTKALRTSSSLFKHFAFPFGGMISDFIITDVVARIGSNNIYFTYVINVGGSEINLILDFTINSVSSNYKVVSNLSKVVYHSVDVSDALKEKTISLFKDTLSSMKNGDFLSFNNNNQLIIDIAKYVDETTNGVYLRNYGLGEINVSSVDSTYQLAINFTPS